MMPVLRYAALGALSGAIAAGIVLAIGDGSALPAFYSAPGIAFGIIVGGAFWRDGLLRRLGWLLYLVAAGLANAAAVFVAIEVFEDASHVFASELLALGIIGLATGALGAALLTLAGKALLPLAGGLGPIAVGALCGILLPVLIDGDMIGTVVFYIVWQAAYAATLARALPPKR